MKKNILFLFLMMTLVIGTVFAADKGNVTAEATDFSELKAAISKVGASGGGTVYIKSNYLACDTEIILSRKDSNVTITGAPGFTPVLDFSSYRERYLGTMESSKNPGISLSGSGYTLRGLIIQKAPGAGIRMEGKKSCNNLLENIVSRYNNNCGVHITLNANNNTLHSVDVYRNCDIIRMGSDADGFAVKLGAGGGNKFYNCRAWENSDDGWDSYAMYNDLTYEECAAWHNGDPEVFTGKYDFDNGRPLDENLLLVQMFMKQDPNFKSNYLKGEYKYPEGKFIEVTIDKKNLERLTVAEFTVNKWGGNPNGFKFGSKASGHGPMVGPTALRVVKNCLVFDHRSKGFDKNNSTCTLNLTNAVAFDNRRYDFQTDGLTLTSFKNAMAFGIGDNTVPGGSGAKVIVPSMEKQRQIRDEVKRKVDFIVNKVNKNEIPGEVLFNIFDI